MTLQRIWQNVGTAPLGLLLAIFAIGAAVCVALLGVRWVVGQRRAWRERRSRTILLADLLRRYSRMRRW